MREKCFCPSFMPSIGRYVQASIEFFHYVIVSKVDKIYLDLPIAQLQNVKPRLNQDDSHRNFPCALSTRLTFMVFKMAKEKAAPQRILPPAARLFISTKSCTELSGAVMRYSTSFMSKPMRKKKSANRLQRCQNVRQRLKKRRSCIGLGFSSFQRK